jgi:Tol biopolymer transport system component
LSAALLGGILLSQKEPESRITRFSILPRAGVEHASWPRISPDGRLLAFQAVDSLGVSQIWIRPLNSLDAYPLAGTRNVGRPFWSPDSKYLAFFDDNQLKKIPVAGGPAMIICEADGADGCWGSDGIILFDGNRNDSIRQVSAAGGRPTAATAIDREEKEVFHSWPCFLPDGRHFLFLALIDSTDQSDAVQMLKVGSLDSKESRILARADTRLEYSPQGYILYMLENILLAHPFDASSLELTGEPVPISDEVTNFDFRAEFSVSDNGTLVYFRGESGIYDQMVWVDRNGVVMDTVGEQGRYADLDLSPDGKRLAYMVEDAENSTGDIWVYDLEREVASRLTFSDAVDAWPNWSPDGTRIAFTSDRNGRFRVFEKLASGVGDARQLFARDSGEVGPSDWVQGYKLPFVCEFANGNWNMWSPESPQSDSIVPFLRSPFHEFQAHLSPNGRYVAYASSESGGTNQIFVRELSPTGGKWQVSTRSGVMPRWNSAGTELFYYTYERDLMAVPVETEGMFKAGIARTLFNKRIKLTGNENARYDVSGDGQRFILVAPVEETGESEFVVVMNWDKEITRR